jgi:hypothetical protein
MNLRNTLLGTVLMLTNAYAFSATAQESTANCQLQTTIVKRVEADGKETITQESKTVCKEGTLITTDGVLTNCGIMQSWKNGRIINTQICQRGDNNWQVVVPN